MTSPVRGLNDPAPATGEGEPEGRDGSGRVEPFPSVEALRSRHAELAKRLRDYRGGAALWDAVREFIGRTSATGAVLDACDDRSVAQAILNYWSSTLYRNGQGDIDAVLALYAEPEPERDLEVLNRCACPYPGLAPFDEGDRENFLGRWRCVQEAVGLLTKHHFLAVVGPTGQGKTSLVRAGLLPALRESAADSPGWRVLAPVEPGPDLLGRLVRAVRPGRAVDAEWVEQQAAEVGRDAGHLVRLAGWSSEPPVVLTVDPFEGAFASAAEQELQAFIRALAALATADSPPHSVVLVVRWEDTPRVVHFRRLAALFEASQLLVEPPSVEELREMIEGPARRVGLRFEAGIVNKLIRDVNGDPWALALLQFALVKLWEGRPRDSAAITWDVYNQTFGEGGARGALLANATRFYEHDLTERERVVARKVLMRLVHTGAGRELVLTRVPLADLSEPEPALPLPGKAGRLTRELLDKVLLPPRPEPEEARRRGGGVAPEEVVDKLRGAKLVHVRPGDDGRPAVELANEVILDKWPAIAGWVYEAHREADLAAERFRMRVALGVAVLTVLLLAILGAVIWDRQLWMEKANFQERIATSEREKAEFQGRIATSRRLVDYTYAYRAIQLDLSLLFGLEAYDCAEKLSANGHKGSGEIRNLLLGEARNALLFILNNSPRLDRFLLSGEDSGPASVVALSRDGGALALAIKIGRDRYRLALWRRPAPDRAFERVESDDGVTSPGPIFSLAFRPDGKVLASGGGRFDKEKGEFHNQVILWDVNNPNRLAQFPELSAPNPYPDQGSVVVAVAFSPDGTKLATASQGAFQKDDWSPGYVRMWDVSDPYRPKPVGERVQGHKGPGKSAERMLGLVFSPDGKTLVSGGGAGKADNGDCPDGEIAFWDVDAFSCEQAGEPLTLNRDKNFARSYAVCGLAFYQPGSSLSRPPLLAAGCLDGHVALVDPAARKLIGLLPESGGHHGFVRSLAFSDDGKRLATGGNDTTVIVWNVADPKSPRAVDKPMQAHHGDIQALVFEEGGSYLRSAARDETWARWTLMTPNGLATRLVGTDAPVYSAAFQPGGTLLAAAGDHPRGTESATAGHEEGPCPVRLWDVSSPEFRPVPPLVGHQGRVYDVAFSPDGNLLASGGVDQQILLWDVRKGRAVREGEAPVVIKDAHDARINSLQFRPTATGRILASASDDKTVKLWDVSEPSAPRLLSRLGSGPQAAQRFRQPVAGLAFGPGGRTLASAHGEKLIRLWDVSDPAHPRPIGEPLIGHEDAVLSVSFSPDGRWLASGGKDNMVLLWEIKDDGSPADPKPFHAVRFHRRPVWSVSFSPDGRWLASASEDEVTNLHLWDTGELFNHHSIGPQLTGHVGRVHRVACFDLRAGSPWLVSAGQDGSVLIWELSPEKWVAHARRVVSRELKEPERKIFLREEPYPGPARY